MVAPSFLNQTWQIARKEIKEHTRSRRFLLFLILFGAAYLITTIILSSDILNLNYPPNKTLGQVYGIVSLFIIIIPIALAYDTISRERANRSIDIVLSKPVSRTELVLGKLLGAFITLVAVIGVVHLAGYVASIAFSGDVPTIYEFGNFGAYLGIIFLGMLCYLALAMLFSTIMRGGATALIVTLILGIFVLAIPFSVAIIYYLWSNFGLAELQNVEAIDLGTPPLWLKFTYAINPESCMNAVYEFLPGGSSFMLTVWESVLAMLIFVAVCLSLSLALFYHKDLQ
jgi:ABC-2 type transport system permease protein